MASRPVASIALLLSLNLLFFSMASADTCPVDAVKFEVCVDALGIIKIPPNAACCSLIANLASLEAALCLCTAIKAKVLGINPSVPLDLSLFLNDCGKKLQNGFQCP
ncbi:hypothetical protein P3X46_029858 [Hevea brasiliensis]|uniref:Bifunctional inhibitor/plant lipid transfer protein/seed storage helical domain-containing protein n=1 Tax=Hevea brasiliensis TaxID=3981 RepID=A0ABQ9KUR1_HEVBR|nr:14 kDa proline-rich protein DC2.15-like [Hevea brasiliensis]KAJ9147732.1 hypothetical protein P3X46_029858 [Hevea brasiliensis]